MKYSWVETTDGVDVQKSVTMDDSTIDALNVAGFAAFSRIPQAVIDAYVAESIAALARADQTAYGLALGRAYDAQEIEVRDVVAGEAVKGPNGSRISIDANGFVYSDGVRLMAGPSPVAVAKLRINGSSLYGLGKTDGAWWQYTGSSWLKLDMSRVDPTVFA